MGLGKTFEGVGVGTMYSVSRWNRGWKITCSGSRHERVCETRESVVARIDLSRSACGTTMSAMLLVMRRLVVKVHHLLKSKVSNRLVISDTNQVQDLRI